MRLLLDTHTLIWWDSDPARLSAAALAALRDPANTAWLSVVSIAEEAPWQCDDTESRSSDSGYFPSLDVNRAVVTGEMSSVYNCISWTVSIVNRWLWPGNTLRPV